jgi:hypothetical protein
MRRVGSVIWLSVSGAVFRSPHQANPLSEPLLDYRVGVASHVHFLKYVTDITPINVAADAIVHPTRWDACSLVALEGFAAGLG